MIGKIIGFSVLGIFGLLLIFMLLRTLLTKKPKIDNASYTPHDVDLDRVRDHLIGAVQIPTVTLSDNDQDGSIFYEYQAYLEKSYPKIMAVAEKTLVNKYAVIYTVKGSDESLLPCAILAHQDVVPAPEDGWEVPPFSGQVKDGYIYGRGSQDMKSQMIIALEGLEILLEDGLYPKRTMMFCFGHDEELRGTYGALEISKYLNKQGVKLEYVIDEGGTILDGSILGINNKIALIGTCEKGYADYVLEVEKDGGHSSAPTRRTSVGILSEAMYKIEKRKRPTMWTKPTKDMFKALAPHMNFGFKLALVNRDILSPLLKYVLSIVSPFTNCLVRTTLAPTQTSGAHTPNTLAPVARGNVNCRLNTGETTAQVQKYIQKIAGKNVKVSVLEGYCDPSPVSDIDTDAFRALSKTISEVFDGYIAAPYPFIAASDAKHYYNLTNCVYRFTPFEKSIEDGNRIHGMNERQSVASLELGTRFFLRLYENTCF
ncbi:MAG: M20/M25/M40 family metallo-hydrolase [Clostridia bacterium]|nr:M20/M25/M40 family metallo-hydrolase [Clostridia bacterium]